MFKDITEANAARDAVVAETRQEEKVRDGKDEMGRDRTIKFTIPVDYDSQGNVVSPLQCNDMGEFFFLVGKATVDEYSDLHFEGKVVTVSEA